MVKVAAAQMLMMKDIEANYRKSLELIKEAAENGARLIAFPEGQLGIYIPQYKGFSTDEISVPLDSPYIKGLCDACRDNHIIGVLAHNLQIDGKIYASMMTVDENGKVLAIQKKHHIVYVPHFYEQDYFTPGEDGFNVVETSIGKIGMIVCFDRHFPESFRTCALKGADLVITPVANGYGEPLEVFEWEVRVPAFQNGINTMMVNRVGFEGAMHYCGQSVIVNYDGSLAAKADDKEGIWYAELDMEDTVKFRSEKQYIPLRRKEVFEMGL